MKTIRLKDIGSDVVVLQQLLNEWGYSVDSLGIFDALTDSKVLDFQRDLRLTVDGIVGNKTWKILLDETAREKHSLRLTKADFERAARELGVEEAVVRAVQEVETGVKGGFFATRKPAILFEGHVFWRELKKRGIDPKKHVTGNEEVLYPTWTKVHYRGGIEEYERLAKAINIHEDAALCSASWGLFQIMGFNYAACGCTNTREFVDRMCSNEGTQLDLFVVFVKSNSWDKYLRELNWTGFARCYNGPGYAQNKYDRKLIAAYERYCCVQFPE